MGTFRNENGGVRVKNKRGNIQIWITAGLIIIFLALFLFIQFVMKKELTDHTFDQLKEENEQMMNVVAKDVEWYLHELELTLISQKSSEWNEKKLTDIKTILKQHLDVESTIFADASGASIDEDGVKNNVSEELFFEKAMEQGRVALLTEQNGKKQLIYAIAVTEDGKETGVCAVICGEDALKQLASNVEYTKNSNHYLFSDDGSSYQLIQSGNFHTKELEQVFEKYFTKNEKWNKQLTDLDSIYNFEVDQVAYIALKTQVPNSNIVFVSIQLQLEATSHIRNTITNIMLAFVVSMLVALLFILLNNRNEKRLNSKEKLLDRVFSEAQVVALDLDSSYNIISVNEEWVRVVGEDISYKDKKRLQDYLPSWFSNELDSVFKYDKFELPLRSKTGETVFYMWTRLNEASNSRNISLLGMNITERVNNEEKMHELAYVDKLTRLPNRAYVDDQLDGIMHKYNKCVVLSVDLDNFKYINDTFGHTAGNKFLYEISQSLLQFRKDSDILARTGGDEFMLITDRYDESNVKELATDILSVLSEGFCLNEITFPTSGSIGIAFYPESGTSIGTLMKNSDTALNKAKQLGRNQYVIYSVEMQDEIVNQMELEEGLKKALANDEFVLYYQPQYNADTGKLYGFEALIRWNHPQRGLLSPYYFVPLAEETGLIVPIGRWVVKEAMGFVKRLNELGYGDLTVSVNASVKQLVEDDFAQTVLEMAKEMQVDPSNIKIEITESLLLDNQQGNNISKIEAINNNGFGVALDDFGTGYSSLTYLQQLPISVLKIDKSFVDYILQKQDEANICYHIIQLAHSINLKVVAEGVESKEQYVWLRDKECDFIQGYVASKPLDGQVILETIENILNYNVDAEG